MVSFIRSLFESALKGNDSLNFAVVTCCLKINREAGSGRADLLLREERLYGRAMILELKVADDVRKMEGKCEEALRQIEAQDYDTELAKDGCQPILKYGICFYKKGCLVKMAESNSFKFIMRK